jgi:hypothetical protein
MQLQVAANTCSPAVDRPRPRQAGLWEEVCKSSAFFCLLSLVETALPGCAQYLLMESWG